MKKQYITYLNIISALAVVFLHTNGIFWKFSKTSLWISANFIESIFYFAVPIFFMCSGATLFEYRKRYDTKSFFKKRFSKTVIPFLIWSIIGLLLHIFVFRSFPLNILKNKRWLINSFFNSSIVSIYWFFIPLFSLYLCIPVLSLISPEDENMKQNILKYIIIIGFTINIFLPLMFNLLKLKFNNSFNVWIISGYIIYAVLGYYIDKYNIKKIWRKYIYLLGLLGLFLHIFETWFLSFENGYIVQTFKGYLNVPCFLYSTAIFLYFKNIDFSKYNRVNKIANWIATSTFGVYLIHQFILIALEKINFSFEPLWVRTFGSIIIFIVCTLIVKLIQKIPKIGKIILP